jgi:hypothetical protein
MRIMQRNFFGWAHLAFGLCLGLADTHAFAADDPTAPQLSVGFLANPRPLIQNDSLHLVYEMEITNFGQWAYTIDSIEAKSESSTLTYSASTLAGMMRVLGRPQDASASTPDRLIDGGRTVIVYFTLDLPGTAIPENVLHSLGVLDREGKHHDLAVAPLVVLQQAPVVVAPPLRGTWIAGDASHNGADAAHRRTIIVEGGKPWIAQRYAIDWVQYQTVGGVRTTWQGPEDRNESYFCYNQPIYSVATGKIVSVVDGLPENFPHSAKMAIEINLDNAAGNHIVVDIGQGNFVLYAHIRPATIKVKVGDTVAAGQVIGRVGNTGNSSEPHLHMHVVDRPSVLGGNGVPYAFPAYIASGPVELIEKPNSQALSFGPIGPETAFTNNYPANNAAVTFW